MAADPGALGLGAEPSCHAPPSDPVSHFAPPLPSALELYQQHSRRLGRFHGMPGAGHLPVDVFKPPPPWQDGDAPVSPRHARRLCEEDFDRAVHEDQEKARAAGATADKDDERAAWEASVALTELVLQHRLEVYHEYHSNLCRAQHRQQAHDPFRQRLTAASSQQCLGVAPHHAAVAGLRNGSTPGVRHQHQAAAGFESMDLCTNRALMSLSGEQTLEAWQPMSRPSVGERAPRAGDFNSALAASMTGAYGRLSGSNVELQLRSAQMQRELDAVLPGHRDFADGMAPHSTRFPGQDFRFGASGQADGTSAQPSPASRSHASLGAAGFDPASLGPGAVFPFPSSQGYSTQSAMMQSDRNDPFCRTRPVSPGMASHQHAPASSALSPVGQALSAQVAALYDGGPGQHVTDTDETVYSAPKRQRAPAPTASKRKEPPEWQEQVRRAKLPTSVISDEALAAGTAWRKRSREHDALAASVLAAVKRPRAANPAAAGESKRTSTSTSTNRKSSAAPKPRPSRRRATPPADSFPISNAAAKLLVDHGMVRERRAAPSPLVLAGGDGTPRGLASAGRLTASLLTASLTLNATAGPAAVLQAGPPTPRLFQGAVASSPPPLLPAAPLTPRRESSSELSSIASDLDSSPTPSPPRQSRQGRR